MGWEAGIAILSIILSGYACWKAYEANQIAHRNDPHLWQPRLVVTPLEHVSAVEDEPGHIRIRVTNPGKKKIKLLRGWMTTYFDAELRKYWDRVEDTPPRHGEGAAAMFAAELHAAKVASQSVRKVTERQALGYLGPREWSFDHAAFELAPQAAVEITLTGGQGSFNKDNRLDGRFTAEDERLDEYEAPWRFELPPDCPAVFRTKESVLEQFKRGDIDQLPRPETLYGSSKNSGKTVR